MSILDSAPTAYTFDDFYLAPVHSEIRSRKIPDLSMWVDAWRYQIPVVASPMNTVTGEDMIRTMAKAGGAAVLHRFMSMQEQVDISRRLLESDPDMDFWAAVGALPYPAERIDALFKVGVNSFCIDTANGHTAYCVEAVQRLRHEHPSVRIMAGNVCTFEGALKLAEAGADAIRVGIGPGSMCTTRLVTGHGVPQLTAIEDCVRIKGAQNIGWNGKVGYTKAFPDVAIIADGGIRGSGDIVKALAIGADAVMLGGALSGTSDTPGETHKDPETGMLYKYYHGMACYSQDTEVLTKAGWKSIPDVVKSDNVATLNPESGELEYHNPIKIFKYAYDGEMIHAKSKHVDLLVTPNHKIWGKKRQGEYQFHLAEDIAGKRLSIPKTCAWSGSNRSIFSFPNSVSPKCGRKYKKVTVPMREWLDFFGFWLAEGSLGPKTNYAVSVSNNNHNLISHYEKIVDSWGIKSQVRERDGNYELTFNSLAINLYLRQFGKAHEKFIPEELKDLEPSLLDTLLNGIMLGDGCQTRDCIYTTSEKLRDDIWELGFKTGKPVSISVNHEKGSNGIINGKSFVRNHTLWSIGRLSSPATAALLDKRHWNRVPYSGNVYCLEVPNHILCVRRNNKHVWCGNSEEGRAEYFDQEATSFVPEGESTKVPYKGSTTKVLDTLMGGTRSGMTYAGASNIKELRRNAQWRRVTGAGTQEAKPHGKR